jgi:hypothetical protein
MKILKQWYVPNSGTMLLLERNTPGAIACYRYNCIDEDFDLLILLDEIAPLKRWLKAERRRSATPKPVPKTWVARIWRWLKELFQQPASKPIIDSELNYRILSALNSRQPHMIAAATVNRQSLQVFTVGVWVANLSHINFDGQRDICPKLVLRSLALNLWNLKTKKELRWDEILPRLNWEENIAIVAKQIISPHHSAGVEQVG